MVTFCGLNPSTADAERDDPTMRREIAFAKSWGFGGLWKVNAYDFRATEPKELRRTQHPASPMCWPWVADAALASDLFVCCWGTHINEAIFGRQEWMQAKLLDLGVSLYFLRLTQANHPSHTLYLPSNLQPILWKAPT